MKKRKKESEMQEHLKESIKEKNLFNWNNGFSIGVPSIDSQHKHLVSLLNKLFKSKENGKSHEVLCYILDGLLEYTKEHFAYEERLFDLHHYEETESHKLLHKTLTQQVVQFRDRLNNEKGVLTDEVFDFLKFWLMNHILIEDKKYVPFMKEKGLK